MSLTPIADAPTTLNRASPRTPPSCPPLPDPTWVMLGKTRVIHESDGLRHVKIHYKCAVAGCPAERHVVRLPTSNATTLHGNHSHPASSPPLPILHSTPPPPPPPVPAEPAPVPLSPQPKLFAANYYAKRPLATVTNQQGLLKVPAQASPGTPRPTFRRVRFAGNYANINNENNPPPFDLAAEQPCTQCATRKANRVCTLHRCLSCCASTSDLCVLRQHSEKKRPRTLGTTPLRPQSQLQPLSLPQPLSLSHSLTDLVSSNATDVRHFLAQINLQGYADLLIDNGFDSLWTLKALDGDILDRMRITKEGHKMLLLSAITQI